MTSILSNPLAMRFSDWVIPHLLSSGCFGSSCKIVNHRIDLERKGEDQFSSLIQFYELDVLVKDALNSVNVVVKFQLDSDIIEELSAKDHFLNEVLVYSKMLPFLERESVIKELFPRFYDGLADPCANGDKDFIVFEDLGKKGYKLANERVFLDYDHCVLALKGLGRFHALSYIAKKEKGAEFKSLVSRLKKKWNEDGLVNRKHMFLLCGKRGVLPLINENQSVELLTQFLKNYDDPVKFYFSLVDPVEPEAVLCHGDFCRNNMFFAYNDDGKPMSVKFFDLQTPQYSSPVTDLSFFLFMNTSNETREKYWDEFLNVYMESVRSVVPDMVPNLDFQRFAVYGYIHSSFFLPVMMTKNFTVENREKSLKCSPYEMAVTASRRGDEKATDALVNIIKFLLKRGYIQQNYF